ncbi:ORF8 [Turkey adenovirus 1]|uniref:ORF8 n=1 Tax=Turkey adenovirus 1 TaxID=878329 RepID=E0YC81_9ADEN|nr:ORF8 [Turkey adenovirus 1]ADM53814.1 ORF8 [Turkey adenovirus 1]
MVIFYPRATTPLRTPLYNPPVPRPPPVAPPWTPPCTPPCTPTTPYGTPLYTPLDTYFSPAAMAADRFFDWNPRWPFDFGTLSFTTAYPMKEESGEPSYTLPVLSDCIGDTTWFHPLLRDQLGSEFSLRPIVVLGRRIREGDQVYRLVYVTVRGRHREPISANQAVDIWTQYMSRLFRVPTPVAEQLPPAVHQMIDRLCPQMLFISGVGLPVDTVFGLRMALQTMRVHTHRTPQLSHGGLKGVVEMKAPRTLPLLKKPIFTQRELTHMLPKPVFDRFFAQNGPSVVAWKVYHRKGSWETWMTTLPSEQPPADPSAKKQPRPLQDWARLGVVNHCLRLKMAGHNRYTPY